MGTTRQKSQGEFQVYHVDSLPSRGWRRSTLLTWAAIETSFQRGQSRKWEQSNYMVEKPDKH